jgi:stress response protein SCP2
VLVFAVVGFYSLRSLTRNTWLPEALASFAILCSLLSLPVWAATTGGNSLQIKEQQVSVGYWIRENLPPGASVGVNDAGAMRYYGGHRTVDLIGLTTNGLALPTRNGVGSLYETLEKMPEEKRPDYFAIYPTWFPGFDASGVLDQEIARFAITDRPEVAGIVGGSEVVVFRSDWSLAQSGEAFQGEGSVKDTLDIADLGSETEHDYEMHMPLIGLEPANFLTQKRSPDGEVVVDGGRGLPGAEEFTIRGLSRNRPVEVVMRTTSAPFALQVQADGRHVGEWDFQPSGGRWQQATFTIPAESVRSGSLRVRLSPPEDAPLETHTAYYYWFVQRI